MISLLSLNHEYVEGGMLCWSLQRSCTTEPVTAELGISQDGVCGGTVRKDKLRVIKTNQYALFLKILMIDSLYRGL